MITEEFSHLIIFWAGFMFSATLLISIIQLIPNKKNSTLSIAIFTGGLCGIFWGIFDYASGEFREFSLVPLLILITVFTVTFFGFVKFLRRKEKSME